MKKIFVFVLFVTLVSIRSLSQCGTNQVEIKVNILTDPWGEETSFTLTNITGAVVLEGGQGGIYEDNSSYTDSVCVPSDDCHFFEIYDTFGDGILAPSGCTVFLDEVQVYFGANDIEYYDATVVNCADSCDLVLDALNDLQAHINGDNLLNNQELTVIENIFKLFPECLAISESNILMSKNVVDSYDLLFGALFTTPNTINGFSKDPLLSPGMELERAMIALQQGIFDFIFTASVYEIYPQLVNGWRFEACHAFPGYVDAPSDSSISISIPILANFEDPEGMNPYYDINQDRTEHALRPTGLYLAPGSIVSVTVPSSLVGQDFWIRVGSHDWDLTDRTDFRRLDRISKKFAINSTTIDVFNPLGGAISVLVPYGANNGIVEVSINNGVEAPFFSIKSFYETSDFEAELNKPGPWAVFETENVMFTIPKHSIVPGQYDLLQAMLDWENAIRGMNSILARQIIPDKHNMYMIADVDIRFGAYSIGYPMSNTPINYLEVPGTAYFLNGPGPDDETNFHEMGHALAISKFSGEEEALVNFPYIMALNYGLGVDLNEAVNYSFVPNTYNIDKTATHRMVSNTFGSARDISNTTTDEVRYQHRGYGHYFEIVNILGWCPLRNFWKQEFIDFENGIDYGINDQDIDSRILRMSKAAKADLRPLFHIYGILPQNPAALQDSLIAADVMPSYPIYNRLQAYFNLIPSDNAAFVNYALAIYPELYTEGPIADPDYGVGWHYLKSLTYNESEAQERADILQSIIDLYFPEGEPTENEAVNVCCVLAPLNIELIDDEIIVTGGVQPYSIVDETDGNTLTVTVVDFDGCQNTTQFISNGTDETDLNDLTIYPNPSSNVFHVDLSETTNSVDNLQLISMNGKVLIESQKTNFIAISELSEGVYILRIELAGGIQVHKKVIIAK
jgi:hypothetical protein